MSVVNSNYGWQDSNQTEANGILIPKIIKLLPVKSAKILDIGCGNGTLAVALQRLGYEVVGIDVSLDGIELARKHFPGIRFEVCSIYDNNFPFIVGRDYNFVISMEVIEHLYWPKKLIEVAYSALVPGGQVIVTTPYHGYIKNLALSLLGGWDKHFTVDWDGGHIKFFSRKTLSRLMHDQGFFSIDYCGVGRVPGLWKSMILSGKK